jgi:hypothetical protein
VSVRFAGNLNLGPNARILVLGRRCSVAWWPSLSDEAKAAYPVVDEECWVVMDDRNGPGHVPCLTDEEALERLEHLADARATP